MNFRRKKRNDSVFSAFFANFPFCRRMIHFALDILSDLYYNIMEKIFFGTKGGFK